MILLLSSYSVLLLHRVILDGALSAIYIVSEIVT